MQCDTHYEGNSVNFLCGADGTFVGDDTITCTAKTCDSSTIPSTLDNSACSDIAVGDLCSVGCPTGYYEASSLYTCGTDLAFTGTAPTCELINCVDAAIPSSVGADTSVCENLNVGDTCSLGCRGGYTGTATTVTCAADGTLTGTAPTCELEECTVPASYSDAQYSHTCTGVTHGSTCVVECGDGYSGTQVANTCTEGTLTGGLPTCTGVVCTINVPFGTGIDATDCSGTTTGNTCSVSCQTGYEATSGSDPATVTCQNTQAFTANTLTCGPASCGDLSTVTGFDVASVSTTCSGKTFGQTCSAVCGAGYTGTAVNLKCKTGYGFDSTAGFVLQSDDTQAATVPTCTGAVCTVNLPNALGVTSDCAGTTSGNTCTASAAAGYQYDTGSGATTLTCGTDGSFTGSLPVVVAQTCPTTDFGTGTASSCSSKSVGQTCYVYCSSGYTGSLAQYECEINNGVLSYEPVASAISCTAVRRLADRPSLRGWL